MSGFGQRPVMKLPISRLERILAMVGLAAVVATVLAAVGFWIRLPSRVPTHFNVAGQPDAWGGKGILLLPVAGAVVLFAFFQATRSAPHRYNFLWPITERNARRQYQLARLFLHVIVAEMLWIVTFLQWGIVYTGLGWAEGLGPAFFWIVMVAIFGTFGWYLSAASRAR